MRISLPHPTCARCGHQVREMQTFPCPDGLAVTVRCHEQTEQVILPDTLAREIAAGTARLLPGEAFAAVATEGQAA